MKQNLHYFCKIKHKLHYYCKMKQSLHNCWNMKQNLHLWTFKTFNSFVIAASKANASFFCKCKEEKWSKSLSIAIKWSISFVIAANKTKASFFLQALWRKMKLELNYCSAQENSTGNGRRGISLLHRMWNVRSACDKKTIHSIMTNRLTT